MRVYRGATIATGVALIAAACAGSEQPRYDVHAVDMSVCEAGAERPFLTEIDPVGELAGNVALAETVKINDQRTQKVICEQATQIGQRMLRAYDQQADPDFTWERQEDVQEVILTAKHRTKIKKIQATYELPPPKTEGVARLKDLQVTIGEQGETRFTRIYNFDGLPEIGVFWTMIQDQRQGSGLWQPRTVQSFGQPNTIAGLDQISEKVRTGLRGITKDPMSLVRG